MARNIVISALKKCPCCNDLLNVEVVKTVEDSEGVDGMNSVIKLSRTGAKPFTSECLFDEEFKDKLSVSQQIDVLTVKLTDGSKWADYPVKIREFSSVSKFVDPKTYIIPLCEACEVSCAIAIKQGTLKLH